MKFKAFTLGFLMFAVGSAMAAAPTTGYNTVPYIVKEIRWDAWENVVWFAGSPTNATGETYVFQYVYATSPNTLVPAPESGNNMEEAKALFSALSLARSLNKNVTFQVRRGPDAGRYVFSSIHIMP